MKLAAMIAAAFVAMPVSAAPQVTAQVEIGGEGFEVPISMGSMGPRVFTGVDLGVLESEDGSVVEAFQKEYDASLRRLPDGFQPGRIPTREQTEALQGTEHPSNSDEYRSLSDTICGAISRSCTVWSDKLGGYRLIKPSEPVYLVEYVVASQLAEQAQKECDAAATSSLFGSVCEDVTAALALGAARDKAEAERLRRVIEGQGFDVEIPLDEAVVGFQPLDRNSETLIIALRAALAAASLDAPDDCFGGQGLTCGAFRFGQQDGKTSLLYCRYERIPNGRPAVEDCSLMGVVVDDAWMLAVVVVEHRPPGLGIGDGQGLFMCRTNLPSAQGAVKRIRQALVPQIVGEFSEGVRRDGAILLQGANPNLSTRGFSGGGRGWARVEVTAIVRPEAASTTVDFIVAYDLSATRMRQASDGRHPTDQESFDLEGEIEKRLRSVFGKDQCGRFGGV